MPLCTESHRITQRISSHREKKRLFYISRPQKYHLDIYQKCTFTFVFAFTTNSYCSLHCNANMVPSTGKWKSNIYGKTRCPKGGQENVGQKNKNPIYKGSEYKISDKFNASQFLTINISIIFSLSMSFLRPFLERTVLQAIRYLPKLNLQTSALQKEVYFPAVFLFRLPNSETMWHAHLECA